MNEVKKRRVKLQWIPAHTGIAGNELADEIAKQATRLRPATVSSPTLIAASKSQIRTTILKRWTE